MNDFHALQRLGGVKKKEYNQVTTRSVVVAGFAGEDRVAFLGEAGGLLLSLSCVGVELRLDFLEAR